MVKPHHALPDGYDHLIRQLADRVSDLDPTRMSPETFLHERNSAVAQLRRIARWPAP